MIGNEIRAASLQAGMNIGERVGGNGIAAAKIDIGAEAIVARNGAFAQLCLAVLNRGFSSAESHRHFEGKACFVVLAPAVETDKEQRKPPNHVVPVGQEVGGADIGAAHGKLVSGKGSGRLHRALELRQHDLVLLRRPSEGHEEAAVVAWHQRLDRGGKMMSRPIAAAFASTSPSMTSAMNGVHMA